MFKNLCKLTTTLVFILVMQAAFASNLTPVGKWKTIDDITGEEKSIIAITETPEHTFQGKVVKLFPAAMTHCVDCKDDKKDQPILGMIVLTNLKQSKNTPGLFENGKIFNPKNGKTYWCNIRVIDSGKKLNVRGYIGLPLFGRSQTWQHISV